MFEKILNSSVDKLVKATVRTLGNTARTLFSIREDSEQLSTRLGKTACSRSDARATPSGCEKLILNKETHEAHYGS
jgi:hypothetical protein